MNFHFMYLLIFRTELDFVFVFVFFYCFYSSTVFTILSVYLSCDKNNIMEHVVSMPIPLSWNDICEIFFLYKKSSFDIKGGTKPQTILWPQETKPDNTMATRNQTTDNTMATRNQTTDNTMATRNQTRQYNGHKKPNHRQYNGHKKKYKKNPSNGR